MQAIDLNSLFSGIIGSILGAVATLLATHWQVKHTIRMQAEADRRRYEQADREKQQSSVRGILGELNDNLCIVPTVHDFYSWTALSTDTWEASRGDLTFLPLDIQSDLRKAYVHAYRYNTKLNDRRAVVDHGRGMWDESLDSDIKKFSTDATLVRDRLQQWASQPASTKPFNRIGRNPAPKPSNTYNGVSP